MSATARAVDPSMEEILASIRRIITDELPPRAVLSATEVATRVGQSGARPVPVPRETAAGEDGADERVAAADEVEDEGDLAAAAVKATPASVAEGAASPRPAQATSDSPAVPASRTVAAPAAPARSPASAPTAIPPRPVPASFEERLRPSSVAAELARLEREAEAAGQGTGGAAVFSQPVSAAIPSRAEPAAGAEIPARPAAIPVGMARPDSPAAPPMTPASRFGEPPQAAGASAMPAARPAFAEPRPADPARPVLPPRAPLTSATYQPRPPYTATPSASLLSPGATASASAAFAALSRPQPAVPAGSTAGAAGRSLEEVVVEAMRPMLKSWLDENLPELVERLVRAEIERIARADQ
ncbi:DUF2497 domain-containing protein [Ancylobacter lacus]|uniref:DUF2497 domain-containing protein n=1 Tax=Ancylobacter lacus TaxID=2579970 RepID=UPI001BD161DC|nr:DUF2497 domain-containing protein [Ancylobacter lacus]MBS7540347.1 DUF2497 domain-containing protein [Ancylobacter lacus]